MKRQEESMVDVVDVFEEMLCQRAMKGFRPVLYVSSVTDLECNMLMLLDETVDWPDSLGAQKNQNGAGYHVSMN